jgi:excisionase family DNA binding protein
MRLHGALWESESHGEGGRTSSPYLLLEEAAEYLRLSRSAVHELTRSRAIPCRRMPRARRYLFLADELDAWINGAALEVRELPDGGVTVTPVVEAKKQRASR